MVDAPTWQLSDEDVSDLVRALGGVRAGLDELTGRVVAEVRRRDLPTHEGVASLSQWLQVRTKATPAEAAAAIRYATATAPEADGDRPRWGCTRTAWAAGAITAEQAVVITTALDRLGDHIAWTEKRAAEQHLVAQTQRLGLSQTKYLANHLVEVVDPDGADAHLERLLEDEEARARRNTSLSMGRVGDGTTKGAFRLPDAQADQLRIVLDSIAAPWRAKRSGTDLRTDDPNGDSTPAVPYPNRMGIAFCELIEHLPTDGLPKAGATDATLVITIEHQQLMSGLGAAMLTTGTEISAGQARRLACNAHLIPAVLDGDSQILDFGTTRRLFTRTQRTALAVRDQGCVFPSCDRPTHWTEAHHITYASNGGPTDLDNGCLLCSWHHHLIHQGAWSIVMAHDGVPEAIPPPHIDPHQT
ncbi:MAG: DUF222 domain-containing protein, partial [Nocardioidaceae bacterium]|nr:DUF222 domain-containing protein [Nocardioidaceae bacterium]